MGAPAEREQRARGEPSVEAERARQQLQAAYGVEAVHEPEAGCRHVSAHPHATGSEDPLECRDDLGGVGDAVLDVLDRPGVVEARDAAKTRVEPAV